MRDIRKKGWFWIENSLIDRDDLNPYEKLLYMTLARYCDNNGKCFPAFETLMKATGINSRATLTKYLKYLEEKELIFVVRKTGKSNFYYLKNCEKKENDQYSSCTGSTDEPVHEMNYTSSSDEQVPVHEVNSNNTHLKIHNEGNKKNILKKVSQKAKKKNEIEEFINNLEQDDDYKKLLFEYVQYRKKIKKSIKTTKPIEKLINDFPTYFSLEEAINIAMYKEWEGLEPEWVENHKKTKAISKTNQKSSKHDEKIKNLEVEEDYLEKMKERYGL